MYYERLIKRESKVTRLLNFMLDEKNDLKTLQCYRLIVMINEAKAKEQVDEFKRVSNDFFRRANWLNKIKN